MKYKFMSLLIIPLLLSGCSNSLSYGQIVSKITENIANPSDVSQYLGGDDIEKNNVDYVGQSYFQIQNSPVYNHLNGSEDGPFTGNMRVKEINYANNNSYLSLRLIDYSEDEGKYFYITDLADVVSGNSYILGLEYEGSTNGFTFLTGESNANSLSASRETKNICMFKVTLLGDNALTLQINDENSKINGSYIGLKISNITYTPIYQEEQFIWNWQEDYDTFVYEYENEVLQQTIEIYMYGLKTSAGGTRQVLAMNSSYTNSSIVLRVPLHIDNSSFYITNKNGVLDSNCQYYSIRTSMISGNVGYDYDLKIGRTAEGHIIFYAKASNLLNKSIYGVLGIGSNYVISMSIKADIALEYDSQGYLIRETFVPLQYQDSRTSAFADYVYTYYAED